MRRIRCQKCSEMFEVYDVSQTIFQKCIPCQTKFRIRQGTEKARIRKIETQWEKEIEHAKKSRYI